MNDYFFLFKKLGRSSKTFKVSILCHIFLESSGKRGLNERMLKYLLINLRSCWQRGSSNATLCSYQVLHAIACETLNRIHTTLSLYYTMIQQPVGYKYLFEKILCLSFFSSSLISHISKTSISQLSLTRVFEVYSRKILIKNLLH